MMTWQIWIKVIIGCLPAGVIGLLFDKWIDRHFITGMWLQLLDRIRRSVYCG